MHPRNKHHDSMAASESEQDQESDIDPSTDDEAAPLISEKKKEPTRSQSPNARSRDPRFNPPPPSPYHRLALVVFLIFLFWAGFKLRAALLRAKEPKIVHASRYSKEFKFRPAASPIITETLKDGRVRLRGALPEPPASVPLPTAPPKKTKKKGKKKKTGVSGKRKSKV